MPQGRQCSRPAPRRGGRCVRELEADIRWHDRCARELEADIELRTAMLDRTRDTLAVLHTLLRQALDGGTAEDDRHAAQTTGSAR